MAKKRTSATPIRQKETFGGANIDHFSPPLPDSTPKAINMTLSFEDALKLHLSLGQILGKLNSYDRSTKAGRRSAVNLCVYTQVQRMVVVEGKIRE
jgi:hypothetical protein